VGGIIALCLTGYMPRHESFILALSITGAIFRDWHLVQLFLISNRVDQEA
jgi:hypothetical protein